MARQENRDQVLDLKKQILTCTNCELSCSNTPVPWSGPSISRIAYLGETPDPASHELMCDLLGAAGFTVDNIAFLNVVSCPSLDEAGRRKAPSNEEVRACHGNFSDQITLINPRFLIVAGGLPLSKFKTNVKIGQMRGHPFMFNDGRGVAMPTFHPSYVLHKGGTDSKTGKMVLSDLIKFRSRFVGRDPSKMFTELGDTCVLCSDYPVLFEYDGTPWCETHMEVGKKGRIR